MQNEKFEIPGDRCYIEITHESERALVFAIRKDSDFEKLTSEEIENFKKDIKDWGKWRNFKKLKKDLER